MSDWPKGQKTWVSRPEMNLRQKNFPVLAPQANCLWSFWTKIHLFQPILRISALQPIGMTYPYASTSKISLNLWTNFTKTVNFLSVFRKIMWKNQKLHLETPPCTKPLIPQIDILGTNDSELRKHYKKPHLLIIWYFWTIIWSQKMLKRFLQFMMLTTGWFCKNVTKIFENA